MGNNFCLSHPICIEQPGRMADCSIASTGRRAHNLLGVCSFGRVDIIIFMTGSKNPEIWFEHFSKIRTPLLLILMVWLTIGMCMKRANDQNSENILLLFGAVFPGVPKVSAYFQQASQTPDPTLTISITASATISQTLTSTSTGMPTSTINTPTPTQTPSPAATSTAALVPTSAPILPTTALSPYEPIETPTPLDAQTPETQITSTNTLIPFPTVSLVLPTLTSTPRLLLLNMQDAESNIPKNQNNAIWKIPWVLIITLFWIVIMAWFVVVQIVVHHKKS